MAPGRYGKINLAVGARIIQGDNGTRQVWKAVTPEFSPTRPQATMAPGRYGKFFNSIFLGNLAQRQWHQAGMESIIHASAPNQMAGDNGTRQVWKV